MSDKMSDEENFDDLFVEKNELLDKKVVKGILKDYVELTKEGDIFLKEPFHKLSNEKKIFVLLLARKVLSLTVGKEELTAPKEIQDITGMPRGSCNPKLTELEEKRFLKSENGKYFVPNYAISKIRGIFNE